MIDNDVSMDVVQRMLDHGSAGMTARYATIKDQTLRREWDRFMQRINITGELVPLPDGSAMSDAAWALENLARAKQTLANGYCGLPLQQTCPHPQRVPDLRQLPHHRRVPARPPRRADQHRTAGRRRRGRRAPAAGRDQRAPSG
ncbi:MAG TPA: hypothetical protein VN213_10775 [Solirubrobacteraceae bacterium]|nr:hypothetical protein [Solirubrobacteraceae bacterium]